MRALTTAAVAIFALGGVAHAQQSEGMIEARLVLDVSSTGEAGGAERVGQMHTGRLGVRQSRRFSVRLPAGKCFVAVGRGGPGIDNLDVALSRGRSMLARDTETTPQAVARWCNGGERTVRARLSVTAFRGRGQFAAALYAMEPEAARAAEAELSGESALTRLESVVERHGRNMRPVTVAAREELAEGQRLERSVQLRPGRCYRVLAAGESGVRDLDLAVIDPHGATLQRDASDDASPTLGVVAPLCPAAAGDYRVALHLEAGEGAFAWQVFGSVPRGSASRGSAERAAQYRVGGAGSSYVAGRVRQTHDRHGEGRRPITDLMTGRLTAGEHAEHRFRVTGGQCYVVIAGAVPSARDVDLEIRDPYGNRRAGDEGDGATPHARVCPNVGGSYVARVYMFQGYGDYGVQVFVGPP